ncbi:MAG: ribose 5-phosphate isomerase A [[Clostridium] scindens]
MEEKEKQKQRAAEAAARHLQDDMTIGLGTGSTAYYLILEAGRMAKAGMRLKAVTTSKATEELARSHHISVILPEETDCVDLAIDGVDEIDREFRAVKGGGGALLREKIVASKAKEVIWIMDESKAGGEAGSISACSRDTAIWIRVDSECDSGSGMRGKDQKPGRTAVPY